MIQITSEKFFVIGGTGNHDLDKHIIEWINSTIGTSLSFTHIDFDSYGDKEDNFRIPDNPNIKGKIVIIFQSIYNKKLEAQFKTFCYSSKFQYGAKKVIAVLPFMNYRRQDHGEKEHEINRNLEFIHSLKTNGVDKLILCDIHSHATLENCEKEGIEAYNVSGAPIFADRLLPIVDLLKMSKTKFYVYSPDGGSVERTYNLAKILNVPILMDMKERENSGKIRIIRDEDRLECLRQQYNYDIRFADTELVKDAVIAVIEDELSSGTTGQLTGWRLRDMNAKSLIFCATHPVCIPGWKRIFIDNSPYRMILFGNTIPRGYEKETGGKITNVFMTKVIASQLMKVMFLTENEEAENEEAIKETIKG